MYRSHWAFLELLCCCSFINVPVCAFEKPLISSIVSILIETRFSQWSIQGTACITKKSADPTPSLCLIHLIIDVSLLYEPWIIIVIGTSLLKFHLCLNGKALAHKIWIPRIPQSSRFIGIQSTVFFSLVLPLWFSGYKTIWVGDSILSNLLLIASIAPQFLPSSFQFAH